MDIWDIFGIFIFLVMFILSLVLSFYIVIYYSHSKESDYPKKTLIAMLMIFGIVVAIFTNFLMIMDIISTSEK